MSFPRVIGTVILVCLLAGPLLAGGFTPEQPPMEPAPGDQSGGTFGQSGGYTQAGPGQAGPVDSAPVDQNGPGQADPIDGTPVDSAPIDQSGPAYQGGGTCNPPGQAGQGQTSPQEFAALVVMLNLIHGDLEMCRLSIRTSNHYVQNVLAIGYLNNARSALARTSLHPAYQPLVSEIHQRLERIRFFLLMNDERTVELMLSQLSATIRSIIVNQGGGQLQYQRPAGVDSYPGATVVPVNPRITGIDYGQGQNLNPPPQSVPTGMVPVSDPF